MSMITSLLGNLPDIATNNFYMQVWKVKSIFEIVRLDDDSYAPKNILITGGAGFM